MNREIVREIGIWTFRSILAAGAIIGGLMKVEDVMGGCAAVLILSFVFLAD